MRKVPMNEFGKDHWSLLGYVETRCVDHRGELYKRHLRVNERRHPVHSVNPGKWRSSHGTRLRSFFEPTTPGLHRQISAHDDIDCLDDLEHAGLIRIQSAANLIVSLTERGLIIAAKLRSHKAGGGMFAGFVLPPEWLPAGARL